MGKSDFYVQFNIEVPNIGDEFTGEAERRLRELTEGHSDIIGASVALENIVKVQTPHRYKVRILLYKRPKNIAVTKKDSEPMTALANALDTVERKVYETREKLGTTQFKRAQDTEKIVYELSAEEVYATYTRGIDPSELLRDGRTKLAAKLMVEEGFDEEAAYYAVDQILRVAVERTETENQ
jgi:ribosome-associated translation inhibitor RaiA